MSRRASLSYYLRPPWPWGVQPPAPRPQSLAEIEGAYADFNDASGAISLIESGLRDSYEGRTRSEWQRLQQEAREQVLARSQGACGPRPVAGRPARRRDHAQEHGRRRGAWLAGARRQVRGRAAQGHRIRRACATPCTRASARSRTLSTSKAQKVTRVGAFDLLTRMDEPERRKKLFLAVRAAVAGDQRQERARQSVSASSSSMAAERGAHRRHGDR